MKAIAKLHLEVYDQEKDDKGGLLIECEGDLTKLIDGIAHGFKHKKGLKLIFVEAFKHYKEIIDKEDDAVEYSGLSKQDADDVLKGKKAD